MFLLLVQIVSKTFTGFNMKYSTDLYSWKSRGSDNKPQINIGTIGEMEKTVYKLFFKMKINFVSWKIKIYEHFQIF